MLDAKTVLPYRDNNSQSGSTRANSAYEASHKIYQIPTSEISAFFASASFNAVALVQFGVNSVIRHVATHCKDAFDGGQKNPIKYLQQHDLKYLAKGYQWRLGYSFVPMQFAKTTRDKLLQEDANISQVKQILIATTAETLPGVAFDLNSMATKIKADTKITDFSMQSKAFRTAYVATFVPYYVRNSGGWIAAFAGKDFEWCERVALGATIGLTFSVFDTLGALSRNKALISVKNESSIFDATKMAYRQVCDVFAQNKTRFIKDVIKASGFRAVAGGVAAFIFSDQGTNAIASLIHSDTDVKNGANNSNMDKCTAAIAAKSISDDKGLPSSSILPRSLRRLNQDDKAITQSGQNPLMAPRR